MSTAATITNGKQVLGCGSGVCHYDSSKSRITGEGVWQGTTHVSSGSKVQSATSGVGGLIAGCCLSKGIGIAGTICPRSYLASSEEVTGRFRQSVTVYILTVQPHHQTGDRVGVWTLLGHCNSKGLGSGGIVIGIACLGNGDGCRTYPGGGEVDTVYTHDGCIRSCIAQGKSGVRTIGIHRFNGWSKGEVPIILG